MGDTLDIPFFLMNQDVRKYQASSNRPTLAPLIQVRVASSYTSLVDENWKATYEAFIKLMADDFRQYFEFSMQQPIEMRSSGVIILDNLLQLTSKMLLNLASAAIPLDEESSIAAYAKENASRPYIAFNALASQMTSLISEGKSFLEILGPNHPQFDSLVGTLNQFHEINSEIKSLLSILIEQKQSLDSAAQLSAISDRIKELRLQFDNRYTGTDFLILRSTLHAAELAAAALTLETPGTASLLFSLAIANKAIDKSESALGIVGNSLSRTIGTFSEALTAAMLSNSLPGSKLLTEELIHGLSLGAIIAGALLYDHDFGLSPSKELTTEDKSNKNAAFSLALDMLRESGALSTISKAIADIAKARDSDREIMAEIIKTATLSLFILSSNRQHDLTIASTLLDSQSEELAKGIKTTTDFLNSQIQSGKISGEAAEQFYVYLLQAQIALKKGG